MTVHRVSTSDLSRNARFVPDYSSPVTRVTVANETTHLVPDAILGNFFEHMASATLGGALAELLANPVFSRRHFLRAGQLETLRANGAAIDRYFATQDAEECERDLAGVLSGGFGCAIFDDDTEKGVPLPWAAVGAGKVAPGVGRVGHAVRLSGGSTVRAVADLASGPSGIRQVVFPPVHRERKLTLSGIARVTASGSGVLEVVLRRRHGAVGESIAGVEIPVAGGAWQRFAAELEVPEGAVKPAEPIELVIRWLADLGHDVLLDRFSAQPIDHVRGFDPDVEAIAQDVTPELRWPGGNFVSYYHWRDGVGPVEDRPTLENQAWGGLEYNLIGTDEYMALCRRIGAGPHITVNAGTATAGEAAAWVEYCNGDPTTAMGALRAANGHPEPYGVRIWEIGNELWGEFQGGNVGGELNARRFAEFAKAMRAASPIPLRLLATGHWFDLLDTDDPRYDYVAVDGLWQSELLRQAPDQIDALSMHWIPIASGFFPEERDVDEEVNRALFAQLVTAERRHLPELYELFDSSSREAAFPAIEIALTEWCPLGSVVEARARRFQPDNFGSIAWGAACLNTLLRMCDRVTSASPNGFLHGGGIKKVAGVVYSEPVLDLIRQYRVFIGGEVMAVHMRGPAFESRRHVDLGAPESDIPWIDALAVRSREGGVAISLVNRDGDSGHDVEVQLPDGVSGLLPTWAFEPQRIDRRITFANPDLFGKVRSEVAMEHGRLQAHLPPHGVLLVLPVRPRDRLSAR